MQQIKAFFTAVSDKLALLTRRNAIVAKPVSVGDRHVVTLCELRVGFGGGGGGGEAVDGGAASGKGQGAGAGGMARACPVAVLVIEGGKVRVEALDQ